MNIIQISRGNLFKRYEKVDGVPKSALKTGEFFVHTANFNEETKESEKFVDSVTLKKINPHKGDLFIGTGDGGITQIGSSSNVIAKFILNGKNESNNESIVDLDNLGPAEVKIQNTAPAFVTKNNLVPNNMYVYTSDEELASDNLIGVDKSPIKLRKKDVFLYLGPTKLSDEDTAYHYVILKVSGGSGSAAESELPKTPEEDKKKANLLHSWFKAPTTLQAMYDIDKVKLSHYESENLGSYFAAGADGVYGKLGGLCHDFPNLTKIRFISKAALLKRLVDYYVGSKTDDADLGFQVARIQGTEFKVWKYETQRDKDGNVIENPNNYPIAVIDDCIEPGDNWINILNEAYIRSEETGQWVLNPNSDIHRLPFIKDKNGETVCLFYPGDEIIVKIKSSAWMEDPEKYIENHTDSKTGAVYIDYSNGNTLYSGASGEGEDWMWDNKGHIAFDSVEITRRGALGNPSINPNGEAGGGLPPDDPPEDPDATPKFGPRQRIPKAYWLKEDLKINTEEEAINSLFRTKADLDVNGKIFLSQLPQTVVGGMQRKSSIDSIGAFLAQLCKFEENEFTSALNKTSLQDNEGQLENWAINKGFLKKVIQSSYDEATGKVTEGDSESYVPSIDVGDYFIYTGPDINFSDVKDEDGDLIESSKNNKNGVVFQVASETTNEDTGETEKVLQEVVIQFDNSEKDHTIGDFLKKLLNGASQKVTGLKSGDIIVVDEIVPNEEGVVPSQSQDGRDTEDGLVTKISIIPSTSSSVSSLIIGGKEVTGSVEIIGKKRTDCNNNERDETRVDFDENTKQVVISSPDAILKSETDLQDGINPFAALCDKKFAHSTSFQYDFETNALVLDKVNQQSTFDWTSKLSKVVLVKVTDENGNESFKSETQEYDVEHSGEKTNNFIKIGSNAEGYKALTLGVAPGKYDANQVFQSKNGVIALLEDLYEMLNFDPSDDSEDGEDAIAGKQYWHQRKRYEQIDGTIKVTVEDSFLRDADKDHVGPVEDTNFVKKWEGYNPDGSYNGVNEFQSNPTVGKERAFQFYYEGSNTNKISFVAETKSNQSTLMEGSEATEDNPVQTIPLHSGVLLNSESVIDCGEWI